jgi:AraC-like DNA-binding protein
LRTYKNCIDIQKKKRTVAFFKKISMMNVERLNRHRLISTRDRDTLRDALVNKYGAKVFELQSGPEAFQGVCNFVALEGFDLSYGMTSGATRIQFSEQDTVRQTFVLEGSKRTQASKLDCITRKGGSSVCPAGTPFISAYSELFAQLILKIRSDVLHSKLSSLLGQSLNNDIEFRGGAGSVTIAQQQLQRIVFFMADELERPDVDNQQLAIRGLEEAVIFSFLHAHEHNYSRVLAGDIRDVSSFLVVQVEEFLEANWHRPITIEEIAREMKVGARNLFATFKKVRGYSPMSFLRRIRLERARSILSSPNETTTVTGVSLLCGFSNAGHFAQYYRRAFGEMPSITLFNARRRHS